MKELTEQEDLINELELLLQHPGPIQLKHSQIQTLLSLLSKDQPVLCDGCNVRHPHEHRCHGAGCDCEDLSCQVQQGKLTSSEASKIAVRELSKKKDQPVVGAEIDPAEILKDYWDGNVPWDEKILIEYPAVLNAMQDFASAVVSKMARENEELKNQLSIGWADVTKYTKLSEHRLGNTGVELARKRKK